MEVLKVNQKNFKKTINKTIESIKKGEVIACPTDTVYGLIALLKKLNCPLTGTSANISGEPASTKIGEVTSQFEKQKIQPDLILNAGNLPKSKPSIVLDLTASLPKILRP